MAESVSSGRVSLDMSPSASVPDSTVVGDSVEAEVGSVGRIAGKVESDSVFDSRGRSTEWFLT